MGEKEAGGDGDGSSGLKWGGCGTRRGKRVRGGCTYEGAERSMIEPDLVCSSRAPCRCLPRGQNTPFTLSVAEGKRTPTSLFVWRPGSSHEMG